MEGEYQLSLKGDLIVKEQMHPNSLEHPDDICTVKPPCMHILYIVHNRMHAIINKLAIFDEKLEGYAKHR